MKKNIQLLLLFSIFFGFSSKSPSQTVYRFPNQAKPFFKVVVPSNWNVKYLNDPGHAANKYGELAILPKDLSFGPYITITSASPNPGTSGATADIINGSKKFVNEILNNVKWNGTPKTITSTKGIIFVVDTGTGTFLVKGVNDPRKCAMYYFKPDDFNELVMVVIASPESYDKNSAALSEIINSIEP